MPHGTRAGERIAAPAATGLRGRLKIATAEAHARLDARLGALDLQRRPDYRRFLEASAAALLPLEDALIAAGVARIFPDWPLRQRCGAIIEDVARLGGIAGPLCWIAPPGFSGVLGMMYVLEGSRLGAKVLLSHVAQSPDPIVARTTAYLSHGAGLSLWPSFRTTLEANATLADEAQAIDGALQAFSLFDEAFELVCRTGLAGA